MFTATLSVIIQNQKQPKCLLLGELINFGTSIHWNTTQQ